MHGQNRPLISLCMIVKNEEENIVRCLKSVQDYVDEIIILDTGSTDWTPLLAKELGATVYFAKWENDFSKARNQSIKPARGRWILYLDADEEISAETGKKLRLLAESADADGFYFSIINYTSKDKNAQKQIGVNLRMFKNNANYKFEGSLHEQIKPSILKENSNAKIIHSGLSILHYGYCSDNANRKQKTKRNIDILQRVVKNNPKDHFSHYNLAVSYYVTGQLEKAKYHYLLAKKHLPKSADYLPVFYRNFAVCFYDLGEYENALKLLTEGLALFPDYPDLYYLQGQIFAALNLFEQAKNSFLSCLKFKKINPNYVFTAGVESFLSCEQLADIYFILGDWAQALDYQLMAVKSGAKSYKSVLRLAQMAKRYFVKSEEVYNYLQKNLSEQSEHQLIKIIYDAGLYELVLKKVKQLPDNDDVELLLITAKSYMRIKNWQQAEKVLQKITQPYSDSETCKRITEFFIGNPKSRLLAEDFELFDKLLLYDQYRAENILSSCFDKKQLTDIYYSLSKKAFQHREYRRAERLVLLALAYGGRSADIYRLYGEICFCLNRMQDGIYFVKQACLKEKNNASNYLSLLKVLSAYMQEKVKDTVINKYPSNQLAYHHMLSLAAFNAKLAFRRGGYE